MKKNLFLVFLASLFSVFSYSATLYSRANTGFYTAGTWSTVGCGGVSCGCTPVAGDNIVICTGYTVTLAAGSITVGPGGNCASITIQSGGTLNMEPSGVLTVKNGGFLTINSGGNLLVDVFTNNNNSDGVTINGTLTVSNTFTNGTGADIIGSGTITVTGATVTNNGTVFGSATCVGTPCSFVSPLPIELLTFSAIKNDQNVDLKWSTATEINNDYFTIERSKDGINFDFFAEVDGAGNSTSLINYSIIDNAPFAGISYYRLKQTDFDGHYSYSDIVVVDYDSFGEFDFNVYPNPSFSNETPNILIYNSFDELVTISFSDITGKVVYSKSQLTGKTGEIKFSLELGENLSSGLYFITASSPKKGSITKKFIVK